MFRNKDRFRLCFVILFLIIYSGISCTNQKAANSRDIERPSLETDSIIEDEYQRYIDSIRLFTPYYPSPEKDKTFMSVSDFYIFDDSLALTSMPDLHKLEIKDRSRVLLKNNYRKQLLDETKISETDSLYVYYYASNILKAYLIKDLDAVAILTPYAAPEDEDIDQYSYMFGFEFPKRLKGEEWEEIIAYIGKNNPFAEEQLIVIDWKKIEGVSLPTSIVINNSDDYNIYLYETDLHKYYLIDTDDTSRRRLVIIDNKTNKTLFDGQIGEGEGNIPSPINSQWAGKLLKGYPPIIFGLEYSSFGCPRIIVVDNPVKFIFLNCDNRH